MPTCREIMVADVMTLEPEMTLKDAVIALRGAEVSGAPVVVGGELVGVVSATDLLEFEATTAGVPTERKQMVGFEDYDAAEEWEEGRDAPASYFLEMWSDAGTEIREAARYMHEARVHRVLVLEDGDLAGIVTPTDIVRAVAENVL